MLQDKSLTGFGFRLPVAMTSGSLAAIQIGFSTHFGIVRHCTKTNGQYFVGFELCEVDESVNIHQANKYGAGQQARESEKETPAPPPQMDEPAVITPLPPSKLSRDDFEMTRPSAKP